MGALAGIDGYRRGWVAAILVDAVISWRTAPVGAIDTLVADTDIAAIDIPIGLGTSGWRACDLAAKAALGTARSRVFMTPPREIVELGLNAPNGLVQDRCRALTGQGVSRQALGLATRILDVDRLLPDPRIIEVHPELSFLAITGRTLASKKSAPGIAERIHALTQWRTDIPAALDACPHGVPADDALDALACLWSAQRWAEGRAMSRPDPWPIDGRGTPMRIIT